jgi:hypothetical protein
MKRLLILLTVLAPLAVASAAAACPNCKNSEAVDIAGTNAGPSEGLPAGFNYSIYFMLGSLFLVIGGVSFVIVKAVRDANHAAPSVARASSP